MAAKSVPPLNDAQHEVRPQLVVDPAERAGRQRGAGHAEAAQGGEVVVARGVQPGLGARLQVARADAQAGEPVLLGQLPEPVDRGVHGVAVVEDGGAAGQQPADHAVPHDPGGRGVGHAAVAGLRVVLQAAAGQRHEQDPAVAVHQPLGQPGRARGVDDPQRVVEGQLDRRGLARLGQQVRPREDGALGSVPSTGTETTARSVGSAAASSLDQLPPVVGPAAEAVAVGRDEQHRLELGEAVDRALQADLGPAGRPHRADAGRGEEGDDGLRHVGQVADDPLALAGRPSGAAPARPRRPG